MSGYPLSYVSYQVSATPEAPGSNPTKAKTLVLHSVHGFRTFVYSSVHNVHIFPGFDTWLGRRGDIATKCFNTRVFNDGALDPSATSAYFTGNFNVVAKLNDVKCGTFHEKYPIINSGFVPARGWIFALVFVLIFNGRIFGEAASIQTCFPRNLVTFM